MKSFTSSLYFEKKKLVCRLTLALMDSDSTTVFFNITPGFIAPPDSTVADTCDIPDEHVPQYEQCVNTGQHDEL